MSNVFWFFIKIDNFTPSHPLFLCIKTKNHIIQIFNSFLPNPLSICCVLLSPYVPFVAVATAAPGSLSLRLLYILYISSVASRVLATISPAPLGKQ